MIIWIVPAVILVLLVTERVLFRRCWDRELGAVLSFDAQPWRWGLHSTRVFASETPGIRPSPIRRMRSTCSVCAGMKKLRGN